MTSIQTMYTWEVLNNVPRWFNDKSKNSYVSFGLKTQTPVYKKQEANSVFFSEKEKSKFLAESLQTKNETRKCKRGSWPRLESKSKKENEANSKRAKKKGYLFDSEFKEYVSC